MKTNILLTAVCVCGGGGGGFTFPCCVTHGNLGTSVSVGRDSKQVDAVQF